MKKNQKIKDREEIEFGNVIKGILKTNFLLVISILCITALVSGTITAEKNTRRVCFGEEYEIINLSCVKSYVCDILNLDEN